MNSVFDWIKEIRGQKRPWNSFSESDKDKFNNYMVHRILSMDPNLIEIVNEVQVLPPDDKEIVYNTYKNIIPKSNKFFKYIKTNKKTYNKDLVILLAEDLKTSTTKTIDVLNILTKEQIKEYLVSLGKEKKEITSLLKIK